MQTCLLPVAVYPFDRVGACPFTAIDRWSSDEAMRRALMGVQRDLVLLENGRELTASSAAGRLSLPSDRSFDTYDSALAHVNEPLSSDT